MVEKIVTECIGPLRRLVTFYREQARWQNNFVMCLKKQTVCTIDFIAANTTSLSKQWVAVVSCGTSEIEIDNVLR